MITRACLAVVILSAAAQLAVPPYYGADTWRPALGLVTVAAALAAAVDDGN